MHAGYNEPNRGGDVACTLYGHAHVAVEIYAAGSILGKSICRGIGQISSQESFYCLLKL